MMTRRDFIKGMGALALIPFIPEMVKPERPKIPDGTYYAVQWKNAGTMLIPINKGGERKTHKVRYTVHPDSTDAEIVEE
jgi:hypothetical protein